VSFRTVPFRGSAAALAAAAALPALGGVLCGTVWVVGRTNMPRVSGRGGGDTRKQLPKE